jgi:hypothetical protein
MDLCISHKSKPVWQSKFLYLLEAAVWFASSLNPANIFHYQQLNRLLDDNFDPSTVSGF